MRFLRALLNSGVFMIVLLAGVTLYLVYSDKIRQDHGEDVPALAESSAQPTIVAPAVTAEQAPIAAVETVNQNQQGSSIPVTTLNFPALDNTQSLPTNGAYPAQQQMPMMQAPQGMQAMPEMPPMPMMQAPQGMQAMPEMAPMPMMQAPQGMQPMHAMSQPQLQEVSPAEQARAAFFAGDLVAAEQQYQALLMRNNDPDLHGELGNVYFAQQQWDKATMEYMLAVDGLAAQGRNLQAQYVIGILMQVNPEKGQQALAALRARNDAPAQQQNR